MTLRGEFSVILDDKYRLTLPALLRKELGETSLVVTKGNIKCLWLYTSEKWEEEIGNPIKENTDPFSEQDLRVVRKFVGPSQPVEIDKAGRILLPESLRKYAGISKDCVIVGLLDHIEIWDQDRHEKYNDEDNLANATEIRFASESLSQIIKRKKGLTI